MSKHTPSPWEATPRDGAIRSAIEASLPVEEWPFIIWMPEPPFALGCSGAAVAYNPNHPEAAEANARLIAAAPDLLAACKRYMEQQQRNCDECRQDEDGYCGEHTSERYRVLEHIEAAIRKAESGE